MKYKTKALSDEALDRAAECLKVLAHPRRLRLIELLMLDRLTVGELATRCGLRQSSTSEHLRLLNRCRLVEAEREGQRIYYRISEPCLGEIMKCIRKRFAN